MNIRIYRFTKTKSLEKIKEKTLSQEYKHLSNEEKIKTKRRTFHLHLSFHGYYWLCYCCSCCCYWIYLQKIEMNTTSKVSVFGILRRGIFPNWDWIRRDGKTFHTGSASYYIKDSLFGRITFIFTLRDVFIKKNSLSLSHGNLIQYKLSSLLQNFDSFMMGFPNK